MRILLFDIDGVLVKPFGYRKAFFDTCKWIIEQGKLNINLPAEDIPALYESHGVTSEWDMLSITAGIMMQTVCRENNLFLEDNNLGEALLKLAKLEKAEQHIDYRLHIHSLSDNFYLHEIPSIGVLQSAKDFFSNLSNDLLKDIYENTRIAKKALITRVFQNFVLGKLTFEQNYQMNAMIDCDSYLRTFDKPLLSAELKNELIAQKESGEVLFAALTARPSLRPKDDHTNDKVIYSPEAEFALDVISMPEMPLIGYGRLQFIEQLLEISADSLIKPDPFHALASIFTLLCGSESLGLKTAADLRKTGKIPEWVKEKINNKLTISVYEDSQGGIRSVISAAAELMQMGFETDTRLYGVTTNKDKEKTLKNLNALVFPDINAALKHEFNL
jgi:hypothetical protein